MNRRIVGLAAGVLLFAAGCNPFAPSLEEGDPFAGLFGDPTTLDGYFTSFKSAYELRDLALYEPLLDSSFIFIYYDFDAQVERQWGFAEELESTRRLFENARSVQLQWNQVISQNVLQVGREAHVVRSFNLSITLDTGDIFRGDGNVNFLLVRPDTAAAWQLHRWRDESEF